MIDDDIVEKYLRLHELGEAYLNITKSMGPSAQLIAFVNYDSNEFSLKCSDIKSEHLNIVRQIESGNHLQIAKENFISNIKDKFVSYLELGSKKYHDKLMSFSGHRLHRNGNNVKVISYKDTGHLFDIYENSMACLQWILGQIPEQENISQWILFYNKHVKNPNGEFDSKENEVKLLKKQEEKAWQTVDHNASEWNEARLQLAINQYKNDFDKYEKFLKEANHFLLYMSTVGDFLSETERGNKIAKKSGTETMSSVNAIRSMNKAYLFLRKTNNLVSSINYRLRKDLSSVLENYGKKDN